MRVPSGHALVERVYVDCTGGFQYYTCVNSGFAGCCSVDACDFSDGCPDVDLPTTSAAGTSTRPGGQSSTTITTTATAAAITRTRTRTAHTSETTTQSSTATSSAPTTSSAEPTTSTTTTATATTATAATAAASSSSASPSSSSGATPAKPAHLSGGALAGIVIGSVLVLALFLAALVLWRRRRRRGRGQDLMLPAQRQAPQQQQQQQGVGLQAPLLASASPLLPSPDEKNGRVVSELLGTPVTPELSAGLFEGGGSHSSFAVSPVSPASSRGARAPAPRQPGNDGEPVPGPDIPRATLQLREQELSRGLHVASWGLYQP